VIARTYATAASPAASAAAPQIPLVLHGIDGRYATALYSAAARTQTLDAVESDLKRVRTALASDAAARAVLETPVADRAAKRAAVAAALGGRPAGADVTKNFFDLLAENGRLGLTVKVAEAFEALMTAHRKEVAVVVTSAKELDSKSLNRLRESIAKSPLVGASSKLLLTNKVDAAILGGLIIEVGDKTVDLSVSSKVAKLDALLKETI
ncbi:ATP synthase F0 subcomplex subunit OSCP atp5, partial [Cladochytrium tenue]